MRPARPAASRSATQLMRPQLAVAAWELNLSLTSPGALRDGPRAAPSEAPIPVVLAQRMRRLAYKLGPDARLGRRRRVVHPHAQLSQLLLTQRRRSAGEHPRAARRLRERDPLADRARARQQRHDPVEPEGDTAVRRRAVAERLEQEAEALARLVGSDPDRVEDLLLHLARVDTDRPSAELPSVHHDVVGAAPPRARVGVEVAGGRGERVVERVPAALVLV